MPVLLTFIACLAAAGSDACRVVEIPWEGTVVQCMSFGQHQIARWATERQTT